LRLHRLTFEKDFEAGTQLGRTPSCGVVRIEPRLWHRQNLAVHAHPLAAHVFVV